MSGTELARPPTSKAEVLVPIIPDIEPILEQDGFVIVIKGRKDKGKTDFSLLLAEICYVQKYHTHIATNIKTESYMIEAQITDLESLKLWLQRPGKKLYILDEAGIHLGRMRFMSQKNVEIFDVIQMCRHYDCGFIAISPSHVFIDRKILDTDILDLYIHKVSRQTAIINDRVSGKSWTLCNIPRTSIRFNSKDVAIFTLKKKLPLGNLDRDGQVAQLRAEGKSIAEIETITKLSREQIKRSIIKICSEYASVTRNAERSGNANHETDSQN
ncbi:MAG: hypothetical protein WCD81_02140 [Candidatus Bathyarchaeia archaeon]